MSPPRSHSFAAPHGGAHAPLGRPGGGIGRAVVYSSLAVAAWLSLGWAVEARAQALPTYEIVAKDGRLTPERIEVPAGKRIKLAIRNEGRGPVEFENLDLRVEKVLAPGASSFLVTPPLRPGAHTFIDEFHPETGKMQLIAK